MFSDRAPQPFTDRTIVSGTYLPTDIDRDGNRDSLFGPAPGRPYAHALSVFNGRDPNGTWKLFVLSQSSENSGSIAGGWAITINRPSPPAVTTGGVIRLSSTTATLTGTINAMGQPSSSSFYFGLTPIYSDAQPPQDAGNGSSPVAATLSLTGLKPGTTYHYQLIEQNASGGTSSQDTTFTTAALVDSDDDGMPDDYEAMHHLDPFSADDSGIDSDADGIPNLQEYIDGTDPFDSASALTILSVEQSPSLNCDVPDGAGEALPAAARRQLG